MKSAPKKNLPQLNQLMENDENNLNTKNLPFRVFIYLSLLSVNNLPSDQQNYKLKLQHSCHKITRVTDKWTENTDIDLGNFQPENKPTYTFTIEQDNIDEIIACSDEPLTVILYEIVSERKMNTLSIDNNEVNDTSDENLEQDIAVARGNIDLFFIFSKKNFNIKTDAYLYFLNSDSMSTKNSAAITTWQIYSIFPLLKELSLCNCIFITFESIYRYDSSAIGNVDGEFQPLLVDIYLEPTTAGKEKLKLCDFRMSQQDIINEQCSNITWESLRLGLHHDKLCQTSLCNETGCKINKNKLFSDLLCTENIEWNFNEIDIKSESAIICNSWHRFILDDKLVKVLEDIIAFNRYNVLIEISHDSNPDNILLTGTFNLSVLLYPGVNSVRFGVYLKSPTSLKKDDIGMPTFAIINVCFLEPITQCSKHVVIHDSLRLCMNKFFEIKKNSEQRCAEYYGDFDDIILNELLEFITQRPHIQDIRNCTNYFCEQVTNIRDVLNNIIACDFNIRFPTNNNIEFSNLMTKVYEELSLRIYQILQVVGKNQLYTNSNRSVLEFNMKLINSINHIKYIYEVGEVNLSEYLLERISRKVETCIRCDYYKFLIGVERFQFEDVRKYLERPLYMKYSKGSRTIVYIDLYVKYMRNLANGKVYNEAMDILLSDLATCVTYHPNDIILWALLHALYHRSQYLPGLDYTRMKYENLWDSPIQDLPLIPGSRWKIFNSYRITFQSKKSKIFYKITEQLLDLGLYKFAEFVFDEISHECLEIETYLMKTTLKIFLNENIEKHKIQTFKVKKSPDAKKHMAFLSLINGHIEYARNNKMEACKHYSKIVTIDNPEDFMLGRFRYAVEMVQLERYDLAVDAFKNNIFEGKPCVATGYHLGELLYKLNRLKEAEQCFSKTTQFKVHLPDSWAFLALINLKLGENFRALECWKYAKLDGEAVINDYILDQLNKINVKDVNLFVDVPK